MTHKMHMERCRVTTLYKNDNGVDILKATKHIH